MKTFTSIDNELLLDDGNTYTSTQNIGQVSASDAVIDLGTDYARYPEFSATVELGAVDNANADETYVLNLRFSSDSAVTADVVDHELELDRDTASNKTFVFATQAKQRYVSFQFVLNGTSPSLQVLKADLTGL